MGNRVPPARPTRVLSALEWAFVQEMIKDPSDRKACAMRAGYSEICAKHLADDLMQRVDVQDAINRGRDTVVQTLAVETGRSLAAVVDLIWKMASYDPADLFNSDGSPRAISEMPMECRMALEGFKVETLFAGKGDERIAVGTISDVKTTKRTVSADMLMRHYGGYEQDNRQHMAPLVELIAELNSRGRSQLAISDE